MAILTGHVEWSATILKNNEQVMHVLIMDSKNVCYIYNYFQFYILPLYKSGVEQIEQTNDYSIHVNGSNC